MSSSNNRFGRGTGRQSDDPRSEPVLSFNPTRSAARAAKVEPAPRVTGKPQAGLRIEPEDAREFGASFEQGDEPAFERDDDFDPRTRREKALDQRVPEAQRPLYHHLFDEEERRRRGFGWVAALGSVAVVAIGVAFAWNNFMSRPAPVSLLQPPGIGTRGNNSGYTTPQQPTTNADLGTDTGSTPSPLAATPSPAAIAQPPSPADQPPTKDIATAPAPKSVPAEPPPPPKKTISEAAANPGSLGPAAKPDTPPAPPAAKEQSAVAAAPAVSPPPRREAAKPDTPKREPRKEASITPPRPAPAPAPQEIGPPPVTEPAAAPAVTPAPRRYRSQATAQPQPLSRNAPADYAPPPQRQSAPQQQDTDNAGPPPGTPDTVTVDGVTYVNGQEPHALGTLGAGPPQAASNDDGMPSYAPPVPQRAAAPAYSARPYTPAEHDGGAPLPNDVIILPSGQMAVPDGQR
jgi:hypothetical protein